jgi:hypothetical protein
MARRALAMLMVIASIAVAYGCRGSSSIASQAKSALKQARRWRSDARLVQVTVSPGPSNKQTATFYFRSPSSDRDAYMVTNGQGFPAQFAGGQLFDPPFIDYSEAVADAKKAKMLKDDPGSGVLSMETQNGNSVLTWNLGGVRVDATNGKVLTQNATGYAQYYNNLVDQAREGARKLMNAQYERWRTCAEHVYDSYNLTPAQSGVNVWARMLYPQNNPGVTIPGPVAQFHYGYSAPGTSASYLVLVPMRDLGPHEPHAISIAISDPPYRAYVVPSGMTNQSRAGLWANNVPRLQAELHDAYNGACHVTH